MIIFKIFNYARVSLCLRFYYAWTLIYYLCFYCLRFYYACTLIYYLCFYCLRFYFIVFYVLFIFILKKNSFFSLSLFLIFHHLLLDFRFLSNHFTFLITIKCCSCWFFFYIYLFSFFFDVYLMKL